VEFLGWRSDEEVRELYQRASAVLLPGIEDFGMVPVEAQACGTPVVALGTGGACETVQHGVTGILVDHESVEAFANGIDECQRRHFDREAIRAGAERFSRERFLRDFPAVVSEAMGGVGNSEQTSSRQTAGRPS
jgi:glycosyltransferase involved in cell wall biosynthesis